MSNWTINGTTLAALNLIAPKRTLRNQVADQLILNQAVADITSDPDFDVDEVITVLKDGTPFFTGTVSQVPRRSGSGEYLGYVLDGPWRELERYEYLQAWPAADGTAYASTLLLNLLPSTLGGSLASTRTQIMAILDWCLSAAAAQSRPAPFQYAAANILPGFDLYPPVDEVRHVSCADAIKRQMRSHPDAVVWFDYSVTPPALKIGRRDALTANNVALTAIDDNWSINPRYDMQVDGVVINYRRASLVDGQSKLQFIKDKWPAAASEAGRDVLNYSIDIQGATISHLTASIETAVIESNSVAWWMAHSDAYAKAYAEGRITNPTISNVTSTLTDTTLVNELTSGQIAPWMNVGAEEVTLTAELTCEVLAADGQTLQIITGKRLSIRLIATDAASGDYSTLGEYDVGDPIPPVGAPSETYPNGGLACILYNALAPLHWEGEVSITAEECAGQLALGTVLNLTGGRTEWATMRALTQSVSEDWETGTTTAQFGPPGHLGLEDHLALLAVGRMRTRFTSQATLGDGTMAAGEMALGEDIAKRDSQPGPGQSSYFAAYDAGANGYKVEMDATNGFLTVKTKAATTPEIKASVPTTGARLFLINGTTNRVEIDTARCNGKTLYIREAEVCVNNVVKRALVLMSDPY